MDRTPRGSRVRYEGDSPLPQLIPLLHESSDEQPDLLSHDSIVRRLEISQMFDIPERASSKRAFAEIGADKDKRKLLDVDIERVGKKMKKLRI
ncbi:hypothetical protein HO133_003614 [Letharia lupina]|uniref:Uncharacterized protein n=1 Tax=Letharia lupina TaxID=560253 RepID=A0A8H6CAQ1_9LECA|nr:uncharacterized protein HO133_003614 [Letharia lupina]KAF6219789.1 hypothetical protein HO133_003614 [Letharia lupina]